MYDIKDSPMIRAAREALPKRDGTQSLIAFLIFLIVSSVIQSVPLYFYIFAAILFDQKALSAIVSGDTEGYISAMEAIMNTKGALFIQLLSTGLVVIAAFVFALIIMKRRPKTIGLSTKNMLPLYLIGAVAGALMLGLSFLTATLNHSLWLVERPGFSLLWFFLFLLAFVIQGFEEEILFRGIFLSSTLETKSPMYAILLSSLAFTLLHGANNAVQPLALVNIFLFGILMSILTLRTGSIWAAAGLHSAWNFALGCVIGSSVSGNTVLPSIYYTVFDEAKTLTSGGLFGIEGGIAATLVLLLSLIVLTFIPSRKKLP